MVFKKIKTKEEHLKEFTNIGNFNVFHLSSDVPIPVGANIRLPEPANENVVVIKLLDKMASPGLDMQPEYTYLVRGLGDEHSH